MVSPNYITMVITGCWGPPSPPYFECTIAGPLSRRLQQLKLSRDQKKKHPSSKNALSRSNCFPLPLPMFLLTQFCIKTSHGSSQKALVWWSRGYGRWHVFERFWVRISSINSSPFPVPILFIFVLSGKLTQLQSWQNAPIAKQSQYLKNNKIWI